MNHSLKFKHPEDAIFRVKSFINELQLVQERSFKELSDSLNMNKKGEEFLFDYVFNNPSDSESSYDDFSHFLQEFNLTFEEMVQTPHAPVETFISTDFGDVSPMLDMSSYEADIDTNFALSFDNSEQLPSELLYNDVDYLNVGHLNLDRAKIEDMCAKELNAVVENHTWNSHFEPNVIVNAVCDVIEKQYNV